MKASVRKESIKLAKEYKVYYPSHSFLNRISGFYIRTYRELSEDFIREYKDYVSWYKVSTHSRLSESFIREFKRKINWRQICIHQNLSESFIREFRNKIDWEKISIHQQLSEYFVYEFRDKLNMFAIRKGLKFSISLNKLREIEEKNKFTRFEIMDI